MNVRFRDWSFAEPSSQKLSEQYPLTSCGHGEERVREAATGEQRLSRHVTTGALAFKLLPSGQHSVPPGHISSGQYPSSRGALSSLKKSPKNSLKNPPQVLFLGTKVQVELHVHVSPHETHMSFSPHPCSKSSTPSLHGSPALSVLHLLSSSSRLHFVRTLATTPVKSTIAAFCASNSASDMMPSSLRALRSPISLRRKRVHHSAVVRC